MICPRRRFRRLIEQPLFEQAVEQRELAVVRSRDWFESTGGRVTHDDVEMVDVYRKPSVSLARNLCHENAAPGRRKGLSEAAQVAHAGMSMHRSDTFDLRAGGISIVLGSESRRPWQLCEAPGAVQLMQMRLPVAREGRLVHLEQCSAPVRSSGKTRQRQF